MTEANHIITAGALRHMATCARRVWLDAHGDPAERDLLSAQTQNLMAAGIRHEIAVQRATADGPLEPVAVESWDEAVTTTRDLMGQGVPLLVGACLEVRAPLDLTDRVFTVRGAVDRLVRLPAHETRGGGAVYGAVEIKQRATAEDSDWVQLDLYAWLLEQVQGYAPPGELWLGAGPGGLPRHRIPHEYDEDRVMAALADLIATRDTDHAPPVRLESHCRVCPWYGACQRVAEQDGSIDLLYNVPRKTRANLRAAGFDSLACIVGATPDALQAVRGVGLKTATRIQANARAWLEGAPVWLADLPESARRPGWMFDLETHEVRGRTVPWCMGWCDTEGVTQIALVALVQLPETLTVSDDVRVTLVPDSDSAWEVFAESVGGDADDAPIYHWTGYDAALLRGSAPAHVVAALLPRFSDLHAVLKQCLSLPLKSTSIKHVARYAGYPWPGHDDYRAAYLDYRYWLESSHPDALARAITYQRADVQSMAHVWRWLVAGQEAP